MKKINKNKSAFTIIELLVVIAIIAIIVLGATNINFNAISNKQKLDKSVINIISQIETVRNNALLGKGIGINLDVPEKYEIHIGNTGSGNIKLLYNTGGTDIPYDFKKKINLGNNFEYISKMSCLELNKNNINDITSGTGKIIITGSTLTLTGACNDPKAKILQFEINRKNNTRKIQINTLNGLVEIVK